MSITYKELLSGNDLSSVPLSHQQNLELLLKAVNVIREKWGKPLVVTSGYRSEQKHKDIYRKKGIPDGKIPMGSAHLKGLAVDFSDPDGKFEEWISANQDLLEELGLWQEHPESTKGWVHLDLLPRAIKDRTDCLKRQFKP